MNNPSVLILSLLITFAFGCQTQYEPTINLDELVLLLETSEDKFQTQIDDLEPNWRPVSNHEGGYAYSNGKQIITKPTERELLFIDQSSTSKQFRDYIEKSGGDFTKEGAIKFFTYKGNYLVYFNDKEYPADILIAKVN